MSSKQEQERPPAEEPRVQRLHQILLWPLRLMPEGQSPAAPRRPWERLSNAPGHPWREAMDEYSGEASRFHERHYREFITFLPYVQRFLYGGSRRDGDAGLKVLRRGDIAQLRLRTRADQRQILLDVVHVDLYFFDDVDVVLLNVELCGADLRLGEAQELLYRLGRAYPSGWDEQGQPLHTLAEPSGWTASSACWRARTPQRKLSFSGMCRHIERRAWQRIGTSCCARSHASSRITPAC